MRLGPWFRGRKDADIADEIESHLQMAIQDRVDRGETLRVARRRALLEFGSPMLAKEATRSVWIWTALEQLVTDLQIGARILWRSPGLSATAVILTALVIGGNTTIFSLVHGVLTKPAPGVQADRLVSVGWITDRGAIHPAGSYPNYRDVATATATLRPMLATEFERFVLTNGDGSYAIQGGLVSTNYFDTLGIRPIRGRSFTDAEGRLDASGLVAVISYRLWRERFGASPDVVGRATILNGHSTTIIGVAPSPFSGVMLGETSDVWVPLLAYAHVHGGDAALNDRLAGQILMIGRLGRDVSLAQAQAELTTLSQQLPRDSTNRNRTVTIRLFPYSGTAAGDSLLAQRGPWFLGMFSIITALTVLIVCANVANLMLGRAVIRAREMAVRQSFGASRARIVRIFVAEGLAISLAAWALATVFTFWTTHAIPQWIPPLDGSATSIAFNFTPDWSVLGYALLLAFISTAIFSAAPALRAFRQDLVPFLKAGEHGVVQGRSTVSNGLVVLQLALSVLLLTTAGLAYRSLSTLTGSELGFDKNQLLLITIDTKVATTTKQGNAILLGAMLDRLRTVRGVVSVSYAHRPVQSFRSADRVATGANERPVLLERNEVGSSYLRTLGVPVLLGKDFADDDAGGDRITAVVNQRVADTLWPKQSPLGQTLRLAAFPTPVVIAGIIPNGFYSGYRVRPDANVALISAQAAPPAPEQMTLYVRYVGELEQVVPAIGSTLRAVNDRAPIVYLRTMETQLESHTWPIRALTMLLTLFALGSLLIAIIGQYAAMAFTMRRRIRDFGIRMALGASAQHILASVVREGLRLTVLGLAIGCALSLATARGLRSMLYGVTPTDALTYVGVFVLLAITSLVACYLPAHHASRIDPMEALRQE